MRVVVAALACALLSACESNGASITIENAWSPPTPPGAATAAVYLTINAREADVLLSATTPIAARAEMHTTMNVDGTTQMRPLERASLNAGESLRFEPGGRHFMLLDLSAPPTAGRTFPLTLRFERAGALTVDVLVRSPEDQG